jgi:hypothetical protein
MPGPGYTEKGLNKSYKSQVETGLKNIAVPGTKCLILRGAKVGAEFAQIHVEINDVPYHLGQFDWPLTEDSWVEIGAMSAVKLKDLDLLERTNTLPQPAATKPAEATDLTVEEMADFVPKNKPSPVLDRAAAGVAARQSADANMKAMLRSFCGKHGVASMSYDVATDLITVAETVKRSF